MQTADDVPLEQILPGQGGTRGPLPFFPEEGKQWSNTIESKSKTPLTATQVPDEMSNAEDNTMSQKNTSRREFEDAIISKAQSDPSFRQALLQDAKAAIEAEFALSIPAGAEFKIVQETDTLSYIVLPPEQAGELSDSELAGVSGGSGKVLVQDVTVNKAKTADKAFNAMDEYIRG